TEGPYLQYHPFGASPQVLSIDFTAHSILFFSSSLVNLHAFSHLQPCAHTSCPASLIHSPTSGFLSNAIALPKIVIVTSNSSNNLCRRQIPTLLPYSNTDSTAKSLILSGIK